MGERYLIFAFGHVLYLYGLLFKVVGIGSHVVSGHRINVFILTGHSTKEVSSRKRRAHWVRHAFPHDLG